MFSRARPAHGLLTAWTGRTLLAAGLLASALSGCAIWPKALMRVGLLTEATAPACCRSCGAPHPHRLRRREKGPSRGRPRAREHRPTPRRWSRSRS